MVSRFQRRLQRDLAKWLGRRPARVDLEKPIISFTFDDFPRSALLTAGSILGENEIKGTYYASFGLMGKMAPTGKIFLLEDLAEFSRQGHELACHTFDHCDSWETDPETFEASIVRNQKSVSELMPAARLSSLSYPINVPRPETKRRTARHYRCARGGGQTFNSGTTDLNYLKAFFIEQSRDNLTAIKQTIDANARANGWLIFATHDVCESPTRYGCSPELFTEIVKYSVLSGSALLPIHAALDQVQRLGSSSFQSSHLSSAS